MFLSSPFTPFICDVRTIFNITFGFLSVFFVCVCVCVCDYSSCWALNFTWTLTTLHCYSAPPQSLNLTLYFTSTCFVCPLTSYCEYRWFYYCFLSSFLLAVYIVDLLPLLNICLNQWGFSFSKFPFLIFMFQSWPFLFHWEKPL